ncbi:hypothetical protein UAW_01538 [Enterococcus haemoperoxidus ATCC BAA-382]|uniref:AAA+ ATPase domain-containing protein n=1 Tax=Enterococcus haemoperoxidus ATCC BAA-382 TaxID=1158608 RepID=R2QP97_9ENTE|nr:ATP-binding protein [Enterococcus haemoperoxidus]EOH98357.1 hypothetical protein UAW_01538 [Enterococcus haemoperoxidus ATCC BAA-382]EOT59870.1 hypothetical protein I583_02505 [Enterococcus haemoperoxidus ATCC BAA-382]
MIIDEFYNETDKSHFYLGMVSQVYRESSIIQIENLSWLGHRKIKLETLIPNTVNYFVVVDSVQGLFIGEIFQSRVSNSESVHDSMNNGFMEDVYPEIGVDIIGLMKLGEDKFSLAGFKTVGITDKVYIANQEMIKKYLDSIEIRKNDDEMPLSAFGKFSNLDSQNIILRPSTIFDRHIMALGATNSGKSTSSLAILDKLLKDKKKVLIIDPTGEYSNSFAENEVKKLKLGVDTVVSVSELSIQQWAMLFETNDATQPAVLSDAIKSLRYQKKNDKSGIYEKNNQLVSVVNEHMASVGMNDRDFILSDLPAQISEETNQVNRDGTRFVSNNFQFNLHQWLVQKLQNKLDNTSFVDFFNNDDSKYNLMYELDSFSSISNTSLYIDTSEIGTTDGVGGMIIDLVCNYLVNKNKNDIKPFVLFIDEVHRYTRTSNSENDYYTGLTSIAREGRKKGIFLFLTTQNPQDVSGVLLGQIGTLLVHRLTQSEELKSIQNHLGSNILGQVKKLNRGEAILSSINLLQDIHLRIDKCGRNHDSDTPTL